MAISEQHIGGDGTLFKGTDKRLSWRIRDPLTDALVNIAGWDLAFVVKLRDRDTAPVISKTVAVVGAYDPSESANTQYAECLLTDDELSILSPKTYRYSLKRTTDGFEDILRRGNFTVELATQV